MTLLRLAVAAVLLGAAFPAAASPAADDRPNIIFIMTDDHATQMMSAYGSERASTPNLDRIGKEGMLFRNSFCTNSLCAPSRATLLTGKYSHKNGQLSNFNTFDGGQVTFPKMLQAAGYQTAIVGKWHLKSDPTGFDYWNILPGQGVYHDPVLIEMGEKKKHTGYVTDIITDLALEWIEGLDREKPFLLLYHHKAPHAEWIPSDEHDRLFEEDEIPLPPTFDDDSGQRAEPIRKAENRLVPDLLRRWRAWGEAKKKEAPPEGLSPDELGQWMYQQYVKDYMRVMASVDQNVGRLLDALDEAGLTDNTLVIYTSDNGKFVGDHFMFDKRLMDEVSLRIPLVVRYPKRIPAGRTTDAFSLNVDYAPTILDYAGVEIPEEMQGRSLRPILEGETPDDWREAIYYHYYEPPGPHNVAQHYGVRTDRYKLIRYYGERWGGQPTWELLDLEKDPHERRDVYNDPAYSSVVAELKEILRQLRTELDVPDERSSRRKTND